jgi:hypothetical protein
MRDPPPQLSEHLLSMSKPLRVRKKFKDREEEEKVDPHDLPEPGNSGKLVELSEPKPKKPNVITYTNDHPDNATYRIYLDRFNANASYDRKVNKPKYDEWPTAFTGVANKRRRRRR